MATPPPPAAPHPEKLEGYLRKLKSAEGGMLGALLQRSKFNRRWFAVEERADEDAIAASAAGLMYDLKYWKVASDVDTKLPGFVLPLHEVKGVDEGVGLGPFTREPHTFHVETPLRTYVLTAATREEMRWWIGGIRYYAFVHQQTLLRLERGETVARGGVIQESNVNSFAVGAQQRRPNPVDLGSPVESSDGSLFGSPSPLPVFSPQSPELLASPFSPARGEGGDRVVVSLANYEEDTPGRRKKIDQQGSGFPRGPSTTQWNKSTSSGSPGNPFATPRNVMDSVELERKYNDSTVAEEEHEEIPEELNTSLNSSQTAASLAALQMPKRLKPGELSSPVRFNHEIETARPHTGATAAAAVSASSPSPSPLASSPSTARSDDPFHVHDYQSASPLSPLQRQSASSPAQIGDGNGQSQRHYPTLDSVRSEASAPPQTGRPGVIVSASNQSVAGASTNRSVTANAPPLAQLAAVVYSDASAPPQTERPGVAPVSKSGLPPLHTSVIPSTNPHLSRPASLANNEDPFDAHARPSPVAASSRRDEDAPDQHHDEDRFSIGGGGLLSPHHHLAATNVLNSSRLFAASHRTTGGDVSSDDEDDGDSQLLTDLAGTGGSFHVAGSDDHAAAEEEHEEDLEGSLDAADESILNGSGAFGESMTAIQAEKEGERRKQTGVPPIVPKPMPKLIPIGVKPGASKTVEASPPASVNPNSASLPSASPPATPLEISKATAAVAAPSTSAAPPAAAAAVTSKFAPSNTTTCRTSSEFRLLRDELRVYGLERMLADQIAAGWFVRTEEGHVEIATEGKSFNPFARLVSGKLPAPYGNLLEQHSLLEADQQFMVACNRPELDAAWASTDPAMVGRASMAQRHQFLLIKSLHWSTFNVATFGMQSELMHGDAPSARGQRANDLKAAIKLLDDMKETAEQYSQKAGWSTELGLFFHAFPFNSVQALHLHLVDMSVRGPTWGHLDHKNLALSCVREVLEEELALLTKPAVPAATIAAPASSRALPPSRSSPLPPPIHLLLTLALPFSTVNPLWVQSFLRDLSAALRADQTDLVVKEILSGSILLHLLVGGPKPEGIVRELSEQLARPDSRVRRGDITGRITSVQIMEEGTTAATVAGALTSRRGPQTARPISARPIQPPPTTEYHAGSTANGRSSHQVDPISSRSRQPQFDHLPSDLSSLLQSDKLPYEDVQTQRGSLSNTNGQMQVPSSRLHASQQNGSIKPAPLAEAVSISVCDLCYSSITPLNLAASVYNWTSHQVMCARCNVSQSTTVSRVPPVVEGLVSFLKTSQAAYCPLHALPAPKLPSPVVLPASSESSPSFTLTHTVRSRASRFVGLLDSYCDGEARLMCSTCRSAAGPSVATRDLSTVYTGHAGALRTMLSAKLLPKYHALNGKLTEAKARSAALQTEAASIRSETQRSSELAISRSLELTAPASSSLQEVEAGVKDEMRKLEDLEQLLHQQQARSPAALCAALSSLPSLLSFAPSLSLHRPTQGLSEALALAQQGQAAALATAQEDQAKVDALPALQEGVRAKDRDLQSVLASRSGLLSASAVQARSLNDLYQHANEEISQWMELTAGMERQIRAFKQSCAHCHVALSAPAANTRCRTGGLHAFQDIAAKAALPAFTSS